MLTSKGCVPGVVPGKQLADDDAKAWKEEQIMKKRNNQGKEFDFGTACVSFIKGNNWSQKRHLWAEMKRGFEG